MTMSTPTHPEQPQPERPNDVPEVAPVPRPDETPHVNPHQNPYETPGETYPEVPLDVPPGVPEHPAPQASTQGRDAARSGGVAPKDDDRRHGVNRPRPDNQTEADEEEALDQEIEETFPASDPPASTQPGGSQTTGPEVARER